MAAFMVVDDRESHVLPFIEVQFGQEKTHFLKKRIEYGDYLLCKDSKVLACIERKSLKDFASSLRDGRMENKRKMFHLRDQTGCQLYYLIEGTAFAAPTWAFTQGMTYQTIFTSMITMPMRDGIHIIQSKDPEYTARLLASMTKQADRVDSIYSYPVVAEPDHEDAPVTGGIPAIVNAGYQVSDEELAVKMWANLAGVSAATAKVLTDNVSPAEVATNPACWQHLRTVTGRRFVKKTCDTLLSLADRGVFAGTKLLSGINGVTASTAGQLLSVGYIHELASMPVEVLRECGIETQSGNRTRVGPALAAKIIKMLNYKTSMPTQAPAPAPIPAPAPLPMQMPMTMPTQSQRIQQLFQGGVIDDL